jgi:hypothetical protein
MFLVLKALVKVFLDLSEKTRKHVYYALAELGRVDITVQDVPTL